MSDPTPTPAARSSWNPLFIWAASLVCAAAAWYLLKELGPLLRPPVLAILLAYAFLPVYRALRRRVSTPIAVALIAGLAVGGLLGVALMVYRNLVDLNAELPALVAKAQAAYESASEAVRGSLPSWLAAKPADPDPAPVDTAARLQRFAGLLLNSTVSLLGELLLILFYLVFLLLEVRRLPARARAGFSAEKAGQLEAIAGSITESMVQYLRAKVLSSLVLAVPAAVVFWLFGVRFAGMWGLLTFLGNFIPYVGSLVATVPPVALAFLETEPVWKPALMVVLLGLGQFLVANVLEPVLTSRAVNLSPFVVLLALTFWGLCWGVPGMILAIPLTVMLKVVWEHVPLTRPLARLMSGD